MDYVVNFAQVAMVNGAVDATTAKIAANTADIEAKKNEVASWFTGTTANTALPTLQQLTAALDDYKAAVARLNQRIDLASNNFRDADNRGAGMFA